MWAGVWMRTSLTEISADVRPTCAPEGTCVFERLRLVNCSMCFCESYTVAYLLAWIKGYLILLRYCIPVFWCHLTGTQCSVMKRKLHLSMRPYLFIK